MAKKYELYAKNPETGKVGKVKEVPDFTQPEWNDLTI